jgi:hypothetical protein
MQEDVSTLRLYLMRATYVMITLFLTTQIWPTLFHHKPWALMHGVANSLLAALAVLMALGIRYPVQMLPALLFELLWKAIWLAAVALPAWSANQQLDADTLETRKACVFGVVLCLIVIPWGYVLRHYVRKPGDRWARTARDGS